MTVIDYYYTSISPFAYLGHEEIRSVAGRHAARLAVKPVDLGVVWKASGAVPVSERSPMRKAYRIVDLKRTAERRGLPLNSRPKFFPVDPALADLVTIALLARDHSPFDFMERVFTGVWVREEDIGDRVRIGTYLEDLGLPAAEILTLAENPESAIARKANSDAAIAAGIPGSPGYVLAGEPFFGQDRIDDLEHALDTGRAPFRAD